MTAKEAFEQWMEGPGDGTAEEAWHGGIAFARKQQNDEIERLRAELDALKKQEPVAWLFDGRKPGAHRTFASVDDGDHQTWPVDDGMTWSKSPLYLAPQPGTDTSRIAIHLKTGNEYRVTGERTNATNVPVQPGALMIDYERDGKKYAREAGEFMEKFAAYPQPGDAE